MGNEGFAGRDDCVEEAGHFSYFVRVYQFIAVRLIPGSTPQSEDWSSHLGRVIGLSGGNRKNGKIWFKNASTIKYKIKYVVPQRLMYLF
jgi:hypothetical protein